MSRDLQIEKALAGGDENVTAGCMDSPPNKSLQRILETSRLVPATLEDARAFLREINEEASNALRRNFKGER